MKVRHQGAGRANNSAGEGFTPSHSGGGGAVSVGFTPGPWEVRDDAFYPGSFGVITGPSFSISFVRWATDVTHKMGEQRDRDARLIAAAPDLYESLSAIVMHYGDRGNAPGHAHDRVGIWDDDNTPERAGKPCQWCAEWAGALAALAKARGEA